MSVLCRRDSGRSDSLSFLRRGEGQHWLEPSVPPAAVALGWHWSPEPLVYDPNTAIFFLASAAFEILSLTSEVSLFGAMRAGPVAAL